MKEALKRSCIEDVQAVVAAGYESAATEEAVRSIEAKLEGIRGGPQIADNVRSLLLARNGERAVRFLESVSLWPGWVVPTLVAGCILLPLVLWFTISRAISGYTQNAIEKAQREALVPAVERTGDVARPLEDVAHAFIGDLAAGRVEAAFQRTANGYRSQITASRFATVSGHPYLGSARSGSFQRTRITGGAARIEGELVTGSGEVDIVVHLSKDASGWAISGVTVAGQPALPTRDP